MSELRHGFPSVESQWLRISYFPLCLTGPVFMEYLHRTLDSYFCPLKPEITLFLWFKWNKCFSLQKTLWSSLNYCWSRGILEIILWLKPWFHSLWLMGFVLLLSWGGFWRCGEHFIFATVKVDQELLFFCHPLWFRVWFCFASPQEAPVVFLCPQASNENVPLVSGHFCVGAGNLTPRSQHSGRSQLAVLGVLMERFG